MRLKKLLNVVEPASRIHLLGKDDVTLAITCPSNIFIMREGLRDKEVLSVEPSYTLRGDKIVGVLTIRIDCDTPLKST